MFGNEEINKIVNKIIITSNLVFHLCDKLSFVIICARLLLKNICRDINISDRPKPINCKDTSKKTEIE